MVSQKTHQAAIKWIGKFRNWKYLNAVVGTTARFDNRRFPLLASGAVALTVSSVDWFEIIKAALPVESRTDELQ